jgi:hypothetical protein
LSFPPPFAFPFDFGPFKMLDSASEVLLKVVDFLWFWFNLFLRRFFEGCVFGLLYHNSFFNILRKNILITCCCLLCRSCYWCRLMGSVG